MLHGSDTWNISWFIYCTIPYLVHLPTSVQWLIAATFTREPWDDSIVFQWRMWIHMPAIVNCVNFATLWCHCEEIDNRTLLFLIKSVWKEYQYNDQSPQRYPMVTICSVLPKGISNFILIKQGLLTSLYLHYVIMASIIINVQNYEHLATNYFGEYFYQQLRISLA